MFSQKDIAIKDTNKDNLSLAQVWQGSVYERAGNLVTAMYLVTGLFPNQEPLKGHLRQKSLDILSAVVASKIGTGSKDTGIILMVEETMSLISTAAVAGIVSAMNKDVLIEQYGRLMEHLKRSTGSDDQNLALNIGHMFAPVPVLEDKGHFVAQESKGQNTQRTFKKTQKVIIRIKKASADNGERKEKIISTIRQKGEVTIKDIAAVVEGYSEKTIQRDLIELLGQGVLRKRVERRWTVYSVA